MFWSAKEESEIVNEVRDALKKNERYSHSPDNLMGFPGTYLDSLLFRNIPGLDESTSLLDVFLHVLQENPNHIGCHSLDDTTSEFKGTQDLERDLLSICAEKILKSDAGSWDGYVASGGTEANIEAMWIFRNSRSQSGSKTASARSTAHLHVLASEDAHYSLEKGGDLLGLNCTRIAVDADGDRQIKLDDLRKVLKEKMSSGVTHFLIILTMGTTNFGSVDDIDRITNVLTEEKADFEIHIDAAFGGFIYPFTNAENKLNFKHPKVVSVTLDAHKMLQSPYGTGIFLSRKGRIEHVRTNTAKYVPGHEVTICGSRSGANSVSIWMILQQYGSDGGRDFCSKLIDNTNYLCDQLTELGIKHYRNKFMNVLAIDARYLSPEIAQTYHFVADDHEAPKWWRVVIMEHVNKEMIDQLIADVKQSNVKFA